MRIYNTNFVGFNSASEKSPRFTLVISFDTANTDLLALTSHEDTATPAGVPVISNVVREISGTSQKINPDKANATIGSFNFSIVDFDKVINNYIRDKRDFGRGLRHKQIKAYVGFEGQEWANYEPVLTYIIDGITGKGADKKFNCSDIQRKARQKIFKPVEKFLSKSVTATQGHIPVLTSSLTAFETVLHDSSYTDRPNKSVFYIRLGKEIICCDGLFTHSTDGVSANVIAEHTGTHSGAANAAGLTDNTQNFAVDSLIGLLIKNTSDGSEGIITGNASTTVVATLSGGTDNDWDAGDTYEIVTGRGALNTIASEHVHDAGKASDRQPKITEHIYIEGPAPKVAYDLLTGGPYPAHWTLGIDTVNVRLSDFENIGSDVWDTVTDKGRHVRIEGHKETDGKKFIETELMFWLGAFMPVYSTGEFGLKRLSPVLSNSGYVAHLNNTNIVSYSSLTEDLKSVINRWSVKWNYVYQKDDFTKRTDLEDLDSIAIDQVAEQKEIELRAVHTGAHTDQDLRNYFDTMRDRYSGPPLRLSLEVLPSLNYLEVGDTVRVTLDQLHDSYDKDREILDRVFEIQQVKMNWKTGKLVLDLFASSQKAGTLSRTTLSAVMDDLFYTSQGTELSTVLTIVGGAVTANGTLTGAPLMKDAVYYYNGDLTIDPGVIVTITQNVELRIKGHLTINGKIDGKGQGHAGGAGASLWSNGSKAISWPLNAPAPKHNGVVGIKGGLGITNPCGDGSFPIPGFYTDNPQVIGPAEIHTRAIVNNLTSIDGAYENLIGTSGSGGGVFSTGHNSTRTIRVSGTAGGNSGAGLKIVARGMSFGSGGGIDLSGDDAPINNEPTYNLRGTVLHGSPGAGGAPGGLAVYLDGNPTPPDLNLYLTSWHGNSPYKGDRLAGSDYQPPNSFSATIGTEGHDMGESAYVVQYIPEPATPELETEPAAPDVTGFTSEISGENILLKWNRIIAADLSSFEIRAGTVWEGANPVADVQLNYLTIPLLVAGTYNFLIKAVFITNDQRIESATATLTTLNASAFIPIQAGATRNTGALADLNTVDYSAHVVGATKPADNATRNTGSLADLNVADYATQVGGTAKPANNATVGATIGVNIGGVFTVINMGSFFDLASINESFITEITESSITVPSLSAIHATLGAVTAGAITSSSFTTATSGKRVEINTAGSNEIRNYSPANALIGSFGYNALGTDISLIFGDLGTENAMAANLKNNAALPTMSINNAGNYATNGLGRCISAISNSDNAIYGLSSGEQAAIRAHSAGVGFGYQVSVQATSFGHVLLSNDITLHASAADGALARSAGDLHWRKNGKWLNFITAFQARDTKLTSTTTNFDQDWQAGQDGFLNVRLSSISASTRGYCRVYIGPTAPPGTNPQIGGASVDNATNPEGSVCIPVNAGHWYRVEKVNTLGTVVGEVFFQNEKDIDNR